MDTVDIILVLIIFVILCCLCVYIYNISRNYIGGKNDNMQWSNEINLSTFWDSWWTYRENYMGKDNHKTFTLDEFAKLCIQNSKYKMLTIRELLNNYETYNIGKYRLNSNTAIEAYPENDRPRGKTDITTVTLLVKSDECVPPIVFIESGDKKSSWLCLDGTHRLVAAKLRNGFDSRIRVCFIGCDKQYDK